MKLIKVAAGVLNQTPLDWEGNAARIVGAIGAAREQGVSILCLPELCITGYGCEDAFLSPDVCRTALRMLAEIAPATRGMAVSVGLPLLHRHGLLNTSCLLADGRVQGFVAKRFLAGDGIHYEPRWFKPWPTGAAEQAVVDGVAYPLGDVHFDCGGVRVGFEICEDAWVANRPGRALSGLGVDVILNPSASHFAFGKLEVRKRLVLEGSRAFGVTYVYSNLLGNEAGRAIYDGGALIASGGRLVAAGSRFGYRDFEVTAAVVDVDATRASQARSASFSPSFGATNDACVAVSFELPKARPEAVAPPAEAWEGEAEGLKEEEFARAVALALFDYLRKSRSGGFVVSLSGGADSSAVCCLIWIMTILALRQLGADGLRQKLAHVRTLADCREANEFVARLLTCVYQATRNSSETTRSAAEGVARALGARYMEFDVDPLVSGYTEMVAKSLGRSLDWERDDIALQNIQARVRAPGVWMVANLNNALLLATSNRSEAAVGYTTMDGDCCGGLSPIAGIDKAYLRRWLRWMQVTGPEGVGPVAALELVTKQAPTAELRPAERHQTDEDDLMPYDLLDAVERAAIRDKLSPVEVFETMRVAFPQYAPGQLGVWVERFFKLWCRNQWKRERYAPSFHLDDENLDPKTWCRFPILSGGFERELAELKRHVGARTESR